MATTKDKVTLDILASAREYIASPEQWSQFNLVEKCGAHCAIGAVIAAMINKPHDYNVDGWKYFKEVAPLCEMLAAHLPKKAVAVGKSAWANIARYNNRHSHKQVLRLFDKALAGKAKP